MGQIIDHDDILEVPILDNPEILDEKAILGLHAILPVEETLDGLFLLVQVCDDGIGVIESACGEDIDVVVIAHAGQKLEAIGPHIELELIALTGKADVGLFIGEDGVDQGFIQI